DDVAVTITVEIGHRDRAAGGIEALGAKHGESGIRPQVDIKCLGTGGKTQSQKRAEHQREAITTSHGIPPQKRNSRMSLHEAAARGAVAKGGKVRMRRATAPHLLSGVGRKGSRKNQDSS